MLLTCGKRSMQRLPEEVKLSLLSLSSSKPEVLTCIVTDTHLDFLRRNSVRKVLTEKSTTSRY